MQSKKRLKTLNIVPNDAALDIIPNEVYEYIISTLNNTYDNYYNDLKALLNLNCVNKALGAKFLSISILYTKDKYITYNPNFNLHKIIHEVLLIQAKNDDVRVAKLLDSGIAITERMTKIINSYSPMPSQQLLGWNVLKAQISLWEGLSDERLTNLEFITFINECLKKRASLNCKNEYNQTLIEFLVAIGDILSAQDLLGYNDSYQFYKNFYGPQNALVLNMELFIKTEKSKTTILNQQIEISKKLILKKIASNIIKENDIDHTNIIEILAGYALLLETLEVGNEEQLIKLLKIGVVVTQKLLKQNSSECQIILKDQYAKNLKLLKAKNITEVKEALKIGAQVNAIDIYDLTPLYLAIESNEYEIVEELIGAGACVNDHCNSLHFAVQKKRLDIVKLLIAKGANINTINSIGNIPLHEAVHKGNLEIVKLLIDKKTKINVRNLNNKTPLHIAAQKGYLEIIKLLIDADADINIVDIEGDTPLRIALEFQNYEAAKLLFNKGAKADVNLIKTQWALLQQAVHDENFEVVQLLINMGANVNVGDITTPLLLAIQTNNLKIIKLLLENGANVKMDDISMATTQELKDYLISVLTAQQYKFQNLVFNIHNQSFHER